MMSPTLAIDGGADADFYVVFDFLLPDVLCQRLRAQALFE